MKEYERLLLAYIQKYGRIDFDFLSTEFHIPINTLVEIADKLLVEEYIAITEHRFSVTDKGKEVAINSWEVFSGEIPEDEQPEFCWDDLFIPQIFPEKI
ncbi:MAG: hypothetical protein IJ833_05420 [Lachnospiraceae bacterium]|nr:hypothetical protein [Lachnospiraceae bacterium]